MKADWLDRLVLKYVEIMIEEKAIGILYFWVGLLFPVWLIREIASSERRYRRRILIEEQDITND